MELGPTQKAWIEALRSGKYKQGRGYLHVGLADGDRYCCLGVLCAVGNEEPEAIKPNSYGSPTRYCRDALYLAPELQEKYGLTSKDGCTASDDCEVAVRSFLQQTYEGRLPRDMTLAAFNDEDVPFAVVADVLEKFPEAYFTKSV